MQTIFLPLFPSFGLCSSTSVKITKNDSSTSGKSSSTILMVNVPVVSPGPRTTDPLEMMKSPVLALLRTLGRNG